MSTIKLFETRQVRSLWDQEKEVWFFSIVDVVAVLTDSPNPRTYWSVLKNRLKKEGSELATNCSQLKMESADGKNYLTDVADTAQLLRLIQSIPSPIRAADKASAAINERPVIASELTVIASEARQSMTSCCMDCRATLAVTGSLFKVRVR